MLSTTGRRPPWSRLQLTGAIVWLALIGCAGAEAPAREDVTLRVGFGMPAMAGGLGVRAVVSSLTSERLFTLANDGRVQPRLVERWSRSDDGLEWTFVLRPNLVFHDGSPLGARNVREILDGALDRPRPVGLLDMDHVTAADDLTVVITLDRPSSLLLYQLGAFDLTSTTGTERSGAGPFVQAPSADDRIVLRGFEHYYAGAPELQRIEFRSYPSVRAAWAALMRDEIDALYEVGRDALEFVQAESTVNVYSFPRPFVHALGFNLAHPVLRDPVVRRALCHAVDRARVIRETLHGHGMVAEGFIWPFHWAIDRNAPAYGFDPAEARRLLDEAGYPVRPTAAGPSRFSLRCLLPSDMSLFSGIALVVQRNLYDIGVDLRLEPIPAAKMAERLPQGDFEAFLFELNSGRVLNWAYQFFHSPVEGDITYLRSGYQSADDVLDRLRHAIDDDQIRAETSALQRVLFEDPPAIFISWDEQARAVSRRFEVPAKPGYDVFTSAFLSQWKLAANGRN